MKFLVGKSEIRFESLPPGEDGLWRHRGSVTVPSVVLSIGADGKLESRPVTWDFTIETKGELTDEEVVGWVIEYGTSLNGDLSHDPPIEVAAAIEEATRGAEEIEFVSE